MSEVSNETMRLKVTQSSAGSDFGTGSERLVRFGDVGAVAYVKQRGKAHWLLPAVLGGVGGLMIYGVFGLCSTEGGINCPNLKGWSVGLTAGGTAAATYGGYRLDRVEVSTAGARIPEESRITSGSRRMILHKGKVEIGNSGLGE